MLQLDGLKEIAPIKKEYDAHNAEVILEAMQERVSVYEALYSRRDAAREKLSELEEKLQQLSEQEQQEKEDYLEAMSLGEGDAEYIRASQESRKYLLNEAIPDVREEISAVRFELKEAAFSEEEEATAVVWDLKHGLSQFPDSLRSEYGEALRPIGRVLDRADKLSLNLLLDRSTREREERVEASREESPYSSVG